MDVGEENGYGVVCGEELGDFDGGREVVVVRVVSGGSVLVDVRFMVFGKGCFDDFWVEDFGEVFVDEGEFFFVGFGGYCSRMEGLEGFDGRL